MMSQFKVGANPPFNPSATQIPKTLEGEIFASHKFPSMHEKPRVLHINLKEVSTIQSFPIETTLKLKENYL